MAKINRKIKDTIFNLLFTEPSYLLKLAQELNVANSDDTLELITIRNLFINGIYNDLGFLVNSNELIVLVEAQSTNPANIALRCLLYALYTIQSCISRDKNQRQIYGKDSYILPSVKAFCIYSGEDSVSSYLNSLDNFKDRVGISFDVVIISSDLVSSGIIYEYIRFCNICNEVLQYERDSEKFALEVLDRCKMESVLQDFLCKYKQEVISLLSQQEYQELLDQELVNEAEKRGERNGFELAVKRLMNNTGMSEKEARKILGVDVKDPADRYLHYKDE